MVKFARVTALLAVLALDCGLAQAAPTKAPREGAGLQFDFAGTLSHFQQQAKTEIGAVRGERLLQQIELGAAAFATYEIVPWFHLGLFAQGDLGERRAGEFGSFDEEGATQLDPAIGGGFWEVWAGPVARAEYHWLFAELGWGALGFRGDTGRSDIADIDGDTDGAFRVTPAVAWMAAVGAGVPLAHGWKVNARLQYRVRYYRSRGGSNLQQDSALGSQSLTPFLGVAWSP